MATSQRESLLRRGLSTWFVTVIPNCNYNCKLVSVVLVQRTAVWVSLCPRIGHQTIRVGSNVYMWAGVVWVQCVSTCYVCQELGVCVCVCMCMSVWPATPACVSSDTCVCVYCVCMCMSVEWVCDWVCEWEWVCDSVCVCVCMSVCVCEWCVSVHTTQYAWCAVHHSTHPYFWTIRTNELVSWYQSNVTWDNTVLWP